MVIVNKMEKHLIAEKANKLLTQFGYNSDYDTCIDITRLATSVGFRVGESSRLHFKIYKTKPNLSPKSTYQGAFSIL